MPGLVEPPRERPPRKGSRTRETQLRSFAEANPESWRSVASSRTRRQSAPARLAKRAKRRRSENPKTVIQYDPWWNPAEQMQATDRAHRIGQRRPVFGYNLIVAGSVEERMLRLQQRKQHLADTILGEGSGGSELSWAEVEYLCSPLA